MFGYISAVDIEKRFYPFDFDLLYEKNIFKTITSTPLFDLLSRKNVRYLQEPATNVGT
uniref:DNA methyltransferase n=1 Tax=Steinernema glaseri TaxID=37863 RepID=A0A1I8ACV3_9BILA